MSKPTDLQTDAAFPRIADMGFGGFLVTFADVLTEGANRAALAFRSAIDTANLEGVTETSTSLTSTLVLYDPLAVARDALRGTLKDMLHGQDWSLAPLPERRKLWTIPAVFGGDTFGPQLEEAASLAGVSREAAIAELCKKPLRVMTIGFAPGQPYLGSLPGNWDIPRQTGLTKSVPVGAITVAIRQIVLFTASTPTGWRHVGTCDFKGFDLEKENPFLLSPGDEIQFIPTSQEEFFDLRQTQEDAGISFGWIE